MEERFACRALDRLLGRPVQIEWHWLIDEPDSDRKGFVRLLRDRLAIHKLCHPRILGCYRIEQIAERAVGFVQPASGSTLAELLEEGALKLPSILEIVKGVAELLDYSHQHGVVHRGLHPGHVFVDGPILAENIKVRHFVTGYWFEAPRWIRGQRSSGLSYKSPESLCLLPVDRRDDIFSLGVIFYELLLRRKAFPQTCCAKHLGESVLYDPVDFPADLDPHMRTILECCLDKDREKRFQSIADLMDALQLSRDGWARPDLAQPHVTAGHQHYKAERFGEAAMEYSQALSLDPYDAIIHSNLGTVHQSLAQWQKAEECYWQAIELSPYWNIAYYNLGGLMSQLERWEEAALTYQRALLLEPQHAASHYRLANCYRHLGRSQECQARLSEAYRLNPELSDSDP